MFIYEVRGCGFESDCSHKLKDCFRINDKQRINMPKKGEYVRFKNFGRK